MDDQIGLEETPEEWCARLVAVMREARRVLRNDGTAWIEIGDSYADKQLVGAPWMLGFALRDDGWILRAEIIWKKPNPMPESVGDRPTRAHSTIFLLAKSRTYFFDSDAIREEEKPWNEGRMSAPKFDGYTSMNARKPQRQVQYAEVKGANARSVWSIPTEAFSGAHFATFPTALVERCIRAGTSEHGCCSECGAPWRRVVERTPMVVPERVQANRVGSEATSMVNDGARRRAMNGQEWAKTASNVTTGWEPSCAHDAPVTPCTVLDMFSGSGTTALVARRLGRHAIGIELSADYLQIAAKRLEQLSLFTSTTGADAPSQ